eukprot:scaffold10_cov257-Pinguiococcus_pyrenoidosus.AAC.68
MGLRSSSMNGVRASLSCAPGPDAAEADPRGTMPNASASRAFRSARRRSASETTACTSAARSTGAGRSLCGFRRKLRGCSRRSAGVDDPALNTGKASRGDGRRTLRLVAGAGATGAGAGVGRLVCIPPRDWRGPAGERRRAPAAAADGIWKAPVVTQSSTVGNEGSRCRPPPPRPPISPGAREERITM